MTGMPDLFAVDPYRLTIAPKGDLFQVSYDLPSTNGTILIFGSRTIEDLIHLPQLLHIGPGVQGVNPLPFWADDPIRATLDLNLTAFDDVPNDSKRLFLTVLHYPEKDPDDFVPDVEDGGFGEAEPTYLYYSPDLPGILVSGVVFPLTISVLDPEFNILPLEGIVYLSLTDTNGIDPNFSYSIQPSF